MFFNITTPKFAAQAIKKNAEIGWKPLHFLNNVSGSIGSVMKPAGFENAQDIISSQYFERIRPTRNGRTMPAMKAWNEFLDKYYPEANRADASVMYAYIVSQGLVHVPKACGDDLTRANVMKQAASIKDLEVGGLLPGVKVNTSPTDFAPLSQLQLIRFKGETWERFGEILARRRRRLAQPGRLQRSSPAALPQGLFCCEASGKMLITTPSKELR